MNKVFNFQATLQRPEGVGTWHYVDTPIQVEKEFNIKGKLPICGKLKRDNMSRLSSCYESQWTFKND